VDERHNSFILDGYGVRGTLLSWCVEDSGTGGNVGMLREI